MAYDVIKGCLICGHYVSDEEDKKYSARQANAFNSWKNDCAKTICEILFGDECARIFLQYFQNSKYCSTCVQIIRDVHFYCTQIQYFQSKVRSLTQTTRNLISENFGSQTKKMKTENLNTIISSIVDKGAVGLQMYSKTEIVEIMYTLSLRQLKLCGEVAAPEKRCIIKSDVTVCEIDIKTEYFSNDDEESILDDNFEFPVMDSTELQEINNKNIPKGRKPPTVRPFKEIKKPKVREDEDDTWTPGAKPKKKTIQKQPRVVPREIIFDISKRLSLTKIKLPREEKLKIYKLRKSMKSKEKTRQKWFPCTEENCYESFRFQIQVDGHVREVHKGELNPYHCQRCPQKFQVYKKLARHIQSNHSKKIRNIQNHICKYCGKGYVKEEELNDHLSVSHQGPNPFKCGFCDNECTDSWALRKHVNEVHSDIEKMPCEVCGKYVKKKRMDKHILFHNSKISYKCEFCDKEFRSNKSLDCHVKCVHKQEKDFICEICGTSLATKNSLSHHIKQVHFEVRPFKCKVCDKSFKRSEPCKNHEVTHTGIRNFVCKVCGKAFFTKTVLDGHELIHQEGYVPRKFHRRKKPELAKLNNTSQNTVDDQNYPFQHAQPVAAPQGELNVQFNQFDETVYQLHHQPKLNTPSTNCPY